AEVLTHGAARVGGNVLHGRGLGSRCRHDDGVIKSTVLFELAHDVGDSGSLLADRNVHASDVLTLLRDDRIHRNSSLTCLAVTNDQLALATTDWHHGVNSLCTSLQGLRHRLTCDHTRCDRLDHVSLLGVDRALAV